MSIFNEVGYVEDIGAQTRKSDNTAEERRKALLFLASGAEDAEELDEWRQMLGIDPEWLEDDEKPTDPWQGRAKPRSMFRRMNEF